MLSPKEIFGAFGQPNTRFLSSRAGFGVFGQGFGAFGHANTFFCVTGRFWERCEILIQGCHGIV